MSVIKAGIVYTATTQESVKAINTEIENCFGEEIEIVDYQDATILDEIRDCGYVTASAAAKMVSLFMQAVADGVGAILCCCSSVGEVVDASQSIASYVGVPIIKIDEEMCKEAVRLGKNIGILATLPTTMEPTRTALLHAAQDMNRQIVLVDGFMEGTFGIQQEELEAVICKKISEIIDQVDVILLAQASMANLEKPLADRFHKPVLSSPRFGVAALARALKQKAGQNDTYQVQYMY